MHIAERKEQLRQAMKERLERLSEKDRRMESQAVCNRLEKLTANMQRICAYYPLVSEPDILPFCAKCLERGQSLYLPVFQNRRLIFREVRSLDCLPVGDLRIPEPPNENPELTDAPDIVIIPGRAFDDAGNRLGRGAGGYDIWLQSIRRSKNQEPKGGAATWQLDLGSWKFPLVIGVCFDCQRVKEVPTEPHDQAMNAVLSAHGPVPNLG